MCRSTLASLMCSRLFLGREVAMSQHPNCQGNVGPCTSVLVTVQLAGGSQMKQSSPSMRIPTMVIPYSSHIVQLLTRIEVSPHLTFHPLYMQVLFSCNTSTYLYIPRCAWHLCIGRVNERCSVRSCTSTVSHPAN